MLKQRVFISTFLCLSTLSIPMSFATEGTSFASTADMSASLWAQHGTATFGGPLNFTLGNNHNFIVDQKLDWTAGAQQPNRIAASDILYFPNGDYLRDVNVRSVGGQSHTLNLLYGAGTNFSSNRSIMMQNLSIKDSHLSVSEDVELKFSGSKSSKGGTSLISLDDSVLSFETGGPAGARLTVDGPTNINFDVRGDSTINGLQGAGSSSSSALGNVFYVYDNIIAIKEQSKLTAVDWNVNLFSASTGKSFTIDIAKGGEFYLQNTGAGFQISQSGSIRDHVNFRITADSGTITFDDAMIEIDEISLTDSSFLSQGSTRLLNESVTFSLYGASSLRFEDQSVIDAAPDINIGAGADATVSNGLGSNLNYKLAMGAGSHLTLISNDKNTDTHSVSSMTLGGTLQLGQTGDTQNTQLNVNSFVNLWNNQAAFMGHGDISIVNNTNYIFAATSIGVSPGIAQHEIGELAFDLNGGAFADVRGSAGNFAYTADFLVDTSNAANDSNDVWRFSNNGQIEGNTTVTVGTSGSYTATELDGKTFTVFEAAAGTNQMAFTLAQDKSLPASITLTEDKQTAANDTYTVVLTDSAHQLKLNPAAVSQHQAGTHTSTSTQTNGNTVQVVSVVTPTSNGGATQHNTVTTLAPNGNVLSTTTGQQVLAPATGSQNTQSAAQLLSAAQQNNAMIASHLGAITNAQVGQQLNTIHAEPYSSHITVNMAQTAQLMDSVLARASSEGVFNSQRRDRDAVKTQQGRLWGSVSYTGGAIDGDNNLGNYDYQTRDIMIGGVLSSSADGTLGAYFSYGQNQLDERDSAEQIITADVYHSGLFINWEGDGSWDVRGLLGYGYSKHDSDRYVTIGNHQEDLMADYDAHSIYLGLQASTLAYRSQILMLSPILGVDVVHYEQKAFEETDGAYALAVSAEHAKSIVTTLGFEVKFRPTHIVQPLIKFEYGHDWQANDEEYHDIAAGLKSNRAVTQTFAGQNKGANSLEAGFGLSADVGSLKLDGLVEHAWHDHGAENSFVLSVEGQF